MLYSNASNKDIVDNLKLNGYGKIVVRANVEEKLDEIELCVLYSYRGDQYFLVKTTDGTFFEYGVYFNLKYFSACGVIRKPEPFTSDDPWGYVSQDIFCKIDEFCNREWINQYSFDSLIKALEDIYKKGVRYDYSSLKKKIEDCLAKHDLLTENNAEKLNAAKLSSKDEFGIDGIAGKREVKDPDPIDVDGANSVAMVILKGKVLGRNEYKILRSYDDEPDGFPRYYLPLDQFDDGIGDKLKSDIFQCCNSIYCRLRKVSEDVRNEEDIKRLYKILEIFEKADSLLGYDPERDEEEEE